MSVFLLILLIICIVLVVLAITGKVSISKWVKFYSRGKDAGFSFREIILLHNAALKAAIADPIALFWSLNLLNECIRIITVKTKLIGQDENAKDELFLSKLYEFRKKLEFEQPRYKKGIQSSKQINEGQIMRLLLEGEGTFRTKLLRNTERNLTLSLPISVNGRMGTVWREKKISLYFWRLDDAGYVFDSYVIDEIKSTGQPAILVAHTDALFRTQKRKSIRTKTTIAAYLYLLAPGDDPNALETEPGYRCIMEDLSEDGCAVTIGGKAKNGLEVRIQFELGGEAIAIPGTVKSSEYNADTMRSLLHIEAFPLPVNVKNRIQAEVFGIQLDSATGEELRFMEEDAEEYLENDEYERADSSANSEADTADNPFASDTSEGEEDDLPLIDSVSE